MPGCQPVYQDQGLPIAVAALEAIHLVASGAPSARLLALLLGLRVPAVGGELALSPDCAAFLADRLPRWADEPDGAAVIGQAITLFLEWRTAH